MAKSASKSKSKSVGKAVKKAGAKLASLKKAILSVTGKKKTAAPVDKKKALPKKSAVKAAAPASKPLPAKKGAASALALPPAKIPSSNPAKIAKAAKDAAAADRARGKSAAASLAQITSRLTPSRPQQDANGDAVCREVACEGLATSGGYCRLHYIKNWKKIKRKELILKEGKLNQYIEELVAKYPDKYIEAIRQDLAADKDFAKVIYDLDLDESVDDFEVEGESLDAIVGDIKRDFDDEGDAF